MGAWGRPGSGPRRNVAVSAVTVGTCSPPALPLVQPPPPIRRRSPPNQESPALVAHTCVPHRRRQISCPKSRRLRSRGSTSSHSRGFAEHGGVGDPSGGTRRGSGQTGAQRRPPMRQGALHLAIRVRSLSDPFVRSNRQKLGIPGNPVAKIDLTTTTTTVIVIPRDIHMHTDARWPLGHTVGKNENASV